MHKTERGTSGNPEIFNGTRCVPNRYKNKGRQTLPVGNNTQGALFSFLIENKFSEIFKVLGQVRS